MGCGKLSHLFITRKIASLVPEFAVEDLPLGGTQMMMVVIYKVIYLV